jgi:hypothetical protein
VELGEDVGQGAALGGEQPGIAGRDGGASAVGGVRGHRYRGAAGRRGDGVGAGGGILRAFDVSDGVLRTIALDPITFPGVEWAPDGRWIAAVTSAGSLVVTDLEGNWQLRTRTGWAGLLAWIP